MMDHAEFAAPSEIVRLISSLVVKDEPPGNRALYLVALAGVCKRWRHTAVEVASNVPIALDGADNAGLHGPKATLLKFRKSDVCRKRDTFLGASKLLKGYTDVTLTGESITDEVLGNISLVNGHNLTSIKLIGASSVTDLGIMRLVSSAPHLKQLVIENTGPGVVGTFVPATLQACRQLETLHIEGAEGVNWSDLHLSGAWWQVLQQPLQQPLVQQSLQVSRAPAEAGRPLQTTAASSTSSESVSPAQQVVSQEVDRSSTSVDGFVQRGGHHQQLHHRLSSDVSEGASDIESDDDSTVSVASDATSISVPAAATAALAAQLLHTSLQGGSSSGSAGASSSRQSQTHLQAQQQQLMDSSDGHVLQPQQQQMLQQGIQCHYALRKLHVRFANVDNLAQLIERCPSITELHLDGPAFNIQAAAAACPHIKRLAFLVPNPVELDAALFCLNNMKNLRGLELEIKGMMLSTEQLRVVGMLPLRELALDSHAYRQQPSMPRPQFSHLDNEGVKGLVDSICHRMRSEMMPLKLSLCGATALKQEAVSALLRLPMLTAIDTGGCIKLTPMDRMRLVAKVKAGQGMLDSKNGNAGANGALAALRVPHAHLL